MKSYTSCFLGIPLPQEFQSEFEKLLTEIKSTNPSIETVQPKTPHITVYYLDKSSQFLLSEISKLVQPVANILNGTTLKISGFDYFIKDNPKVLFLDVTYSTALISFNNKMSKLLEKYNALDNNLLFHPHMTVGRIKNKQAEKSFYENKQNLESKLATIDWSFEVKELVLYGVDSTKSPEHQEKLITIPVE